MDYISQDKMLYSKKKANFFSLKTPQGRCPVWVDSSFKAPWLPCNIEECVIIAREWQRGEDHILAFKCFYTEMKKKKSLIFYWPEKDIWACPTLRSSTLTISFNDTTPKCRVWEIWPTKQWFIREQKKKDKKSNGWFKHRGQHSPPPPFFKNSILGH